MEQGLSPVSPSPEEETLFGRTKPEIVKFDDVMDLKTDRKVSRYFGKEEAEGRSRLVEGLHRRSGSLGLESEDEMSEGCGKTEKSIGSEMEVEDDDDGDKTRGAGNRSSSPEKSQDDSADNKMETMENMPLDLSVKSDVRDTYLMERRMASPSSPGCRDSCTDSEDSDGPGGKTHGKAYKKSLMKRYRKCPLPLFVI